MRPHPTRTLTPIGSTSVQGHVIHALDRETNRPGSLTSSPVCPIIRRNALTNFCPGPGKRRVRPHPPPPPPREHPPNPSYENICGLPRMRTKEMAARLKFRSRLERNESRKKVRPMPRPFVPVPVVVQRLREKHRLRTHATAGVCIQVEFDFLSERREDGMALH